MRRVRIAVLLGLGILTANRSAADYAFPPFDLAVTDAFTTLALDTAGVPAGTYSGYVVTIDGGPPFDYQDPVWRLRTDGLPVPLADPGLNEEPSGDPTWAGEFTATYIGGDPLYFDLRASLQGVSGTMTNITITLISGEVPPADPPLAIDLGPLMADDFGMSAMLDSNGLRWVRFEVAEISAADCGVLRFDTLGSELFGGTYAGGNDPELALYDATGLLIASNDDIDQIGGNLQAALSFGVDEGVPVVSAGDLPAGAYYLVIAGFDAEFCLSQFSVSTDSGVEGDLAVNFRRNIPAADCNGTLLADVCEIAAGSSADVNSNSVPDECEDCNANGIVDEFDIRDGDSRDCDRSGVPDDCEILNGDVPDCNANAVPDACELVSSPHTCCLTSAQSGGGGCDDANIQDCVCWLLPSCCTLAGSEGTWGPECVALVVDGTCGWCERSLDCNTNAVPDECDLASGSANDCNQNLIPDVCDVATGLADDYDGDGLLDLCDDDIDGDGVLNANDQCPQTPLEEAVNAFGGPLGDFNANCIVNLVDYARMQPCLNQSGPGGSGEPICLECVRLRRGWRCRPARLRRDAAGDRRVSAVSKEPNQSRARKEAETRGLRWEAEECFRTGASAGCPASDRDGRRTRRVGSARASASRRAAC
jgi:hypothetical protein